MCTHYTTHLRSNTASSNHQYAGNPFHVNQAQVCREVLEHVHTSKNMLLHGVLCSGLFKCRRAVIHGSCLERTCGVLSEHHVVLASVTVSQVKVSVRCATVQWFHGKGNALEVVLDSQLSLWEQYLTDWHARLEACEKPASCIAARHACNYSAAQDTAEM